MDPKPIEFWRERIEKNPGSVRLRHENGDWFIPFFLEHPNTRNPQAGGKNEAGRMCSYSITASAWTEDKPKIVRWIWAAKDGHISYYLCTEDEQKRNWSDHTIKLEWSRTEFE